VQAARQASSSEVRQVKKYLKDFWGEGKYVLAITQDKKIFAVGEVISPHGEQYIHLELSVVKQFIKDVEDGKREEEL
jgi:hypothetical protein